MEKNAIVTGASRGLGKAIAERFAREGINVWACASKPNEQFEQWADDMEKKHGIWMKPVYFDLCDEDQTRQQLREILAEKKPIDVLVNNAGMAYGALMNMTPLAKLREVMEINFIAQIGVTQVISRSMMRQRRGCIVNIGSVGGIEAREGYLAYGASKAAFLWATRMMSKELAPYHIRVNAVAPGLLNTDMGMYKSDDERAKIIEANSMKRLGKPEEVANVVCFLASEEASFLTGAVVNVDGGRLL